jgi:hypothetical protein
LARSSSPIAGGGGDDLGFGCYRGVRFLLPSGLRGEEEDNAFFCALNSLLFRSAQDLTSGRVSTFSTGSNYNAAKDAKELISGTLRYKMKESLDLRCSESWFQMP